MMYYLQVNFLVQILLVFTCQVQTSKAYESQRNSLKEQFQKALINDSEKLLTLQQVFLTPHPKNPNGQYLYVSVNVEGRISDKNEYDFYDYYDCTKYFPQNNLCVYNASMEFEISPPYQFSTVINFLNKAHDISLVLAVLDPSFFGLSRAFQYFDSFSSGYMLDIYVDEVEIMPEEIPTDVRDALYLTLSWVSLNDFTYMHDNCVM